jgi:hypothetical protein
MPAISPMAVALLLAVPLMLLGLGSGLVQLRAWKILLHRKHVPSDERQYLRGRYRRRLFAAMLMMLAGALIACAYLSGLEADADALAAPNADGTKKEMTPEDRAFLRWYGAYWIGVILLAFVLVTIALADALATRRYWLSVYKQLKDDHQTMLRRDLAVFRQDHRSRHGPRGGRDWRGRGGDGAAIDPGAL